MGTSVRARRCERARFVLALGLVGGACSPAPEPGSPAGPTGSPPPAAPTDPGPPTVSLPPAATASATPATATSASPPSAGADRWVGQWTSPACGARTYERWLDLAADGSVTGSDRVSPCPPGRTCVWSGIVAWSGTWQAAGDAVTLGVTWKDNPAAAARLTLPKQLVWDPAGAGPAEADGGQTCGYRRRPPPVHPPKL